MKALLTLTLLLGLNMPVFAAEMVVVETATAETEEKKECTKEKACSEKKECAEKKECSEEKACSAKKDCAEGKVCEKTEKAEM